MYGEMSLEVDICDVVWSMGLYIHINITSYYRAAVHTKVQKTACRDNG
jgi:hypothetical protein